MCSIYAKADPILYESRSRSVRIRGVVTSLRLENMVWDVIAEIARRSEVTTNQLITILYDEVIESRGEVPNFASFLRVSCLRYLSLQLRRTDFPVEGGRFGVIEGGTANIRQMTSPHS
ncbi:MAG: ribbon-helix-helix domain-containing protein [Dongiaceae bacterium]